MSSSSPVSFRVPGKAGSKGRPRFARETGVAFTPAATRTYEGIVRTAAADAMSGRRVIEGAVVLSLVAVFDVPKGFSRARRAAALEGGEFPAKRPDLDNIVKIVTDAMNGIVIKDDAQIVTSRCAKVYGPAPMVRVTVTPL